MIKLNGEILEFKTFSNGESYLDIDLWAIEPATHVTVRMLFENDVDIFRLQMLKDFLDENGISADLVMPYIPYSRMDRKEGNRLFSLKTFTKLINNMGWTKVTVEEPHSDVSVALLNKVDVINRTSQLVVSALSDAQRTADPKDDTDLMKWADEHNYYLVFPDSGAEKRYSKQFSDYKKVIACSKHRDFNSSRIKTLEAHVPEGIGTFHAIIMDDLCSYGGTFLRAAEDLRKKGADEVILCVTHCEDGIMKGDFPSTKLIDKVFTTDSIIKNAGDPRIIVYNYNH